MVRPKAIDSEQFQVEPDPERLRNVDVTEAWGSYDKLHAHTGWKPEKDLGDVLADLLTYWRERESGSVV